MIVEKIKAFFKLLRWFHELVAIIPFVGLYFVTQHLIQKAGITCGLSATDFCILCFCVQLLIAAGCVFNDIMDRQIDKINKPETHIIERTISLSAAKNIFAVLSILIFALSIYISVYMFREWAYISAIVYTLSFVYNAWLKRTPLFGNILMAFLAAFIPLVILFFAKTCIAELHNDKLVRLVYLYALYPFLIIIPRELSLDISDMEGDRSVGCKTLPLVIGERKAKQVVYLFLMLILIVSVVFICVYPYLRLSFIITDSLIVIYMYKLKKVESRIEYIRIGRFLWTIMIVGLISFTLTTLMD